MERQRSLESVENSVFLVKNAVEQNCGILTQFLVETVDSYPRCCVQACAVLKKIVEDKTGIFLERHTGTFTNVEKNEECKFHAWLEYGDLIIDPTDYQFQAVDLWSLPLTIENFTPDDKSVMTEENRKDWQKIMMDTYMQKALKRYQESPNEKERYFLDLKVLVKERKMGPDIFIEELKRSFGARFFYSKKDKNFIFESSE